MTETAGNVIAAMDGLDLLIALSRLSADEREAVVDRYLLDAKTVEIARMLGVSRQGAEQILARAMRKLRVELEPRRLELVA